MKTDYPKIDIYWNGIYQASTTWSKTCKEAVRRWLDKNGMLKIPHGDVKAYFNKERK